MFSIPQAASFVAVFKAYQSSDHVTEATGKTIAITISKAGGAFGNPNAGATNATEIANGWYKVTLDATDTGTVGLLALRGTASGIDDIGDRFLVETRPANFASLSIDGSGRIDVGKIGGTAQTARDIGASVLLSPGTGTGQISLSSGAVTVGTNSDKTGYALTAAYDAAKTAAQAGDAMTLSGDFTATMKASLNAATPAVTVSDKTGFKLASDGLSAVTAWTVAVTGDITGNLSGSVGSVTGLTVSNLDVAVSTRLAGSSYAAPLDAAGVRSAVGLASANLDTQLAAIDSDVNSRLAATSYTAPDNASVAAIKAKTDNLPVNPAATGDAMTLTATYDAAKNAASQTSVDAVATNLTAVRASTDNLPSDPADESLVIAATDAIMARIGAPAGASVSADVAAIASDTAAVKTKTDSLTFTVVGELDANIKAVNDVSVAGLGTTGSPWGPA